MEFLVAFLPRKVMMKLQEKYFPTMFSYLEATVFFQSEFRPIILSTLQFKSPLINNFSACKLDLILWSHDFGCLCLWSIIFWCLSGLCRISCGELISSGFVQRRVNLFVYFWCILVIHKYGVHWGIFIRTQQFSPIQSPILSPSLFSCLPLVLSLYSIGIHFIDWLVDWYMVAIYIIGMHCIVFPPAHSIIWSTLFPSSFPCLPLLPPSWFFASTL